MAAARDWLADKTIRAVRIDWREDIRRWHPGQDWILAAGGFGVFDPGINALSIATHILPDALRVEAATLHIPANRAAPIAATLAMLLGHAVPVSVAFDFLQSGPQSWTIAVDTDGGTLALRDGGARLFLDETEQPLASDDEYPRLYRRFAALIAARAIDVDLRPLQLVADAFLIGRIVSAAPFDF